jgi:hypothetical protein
MIDWSLVQCAEKIRLIDLRPSGPYEQSFFRRGGG